MKDLAKSNELETRLLRYAADIIRLTRSMNGDFTQRHISQQLVRSGTSPLANYGEAQSAESDKDFIHKLGLSLKELRESDRWLKLIKIVPLSEDNPLLDHLLDETNQLCRIFNSSIQTVRSRTQPSN